MGLLGDVRTDHGLWNKFSATPVATSSPSVVCSAQVDLVLGTAGVLGLPFTFANHFDTGGTLEAVKLYRSLPPIAGARLSLHNRFSISYGS